MRHFITLLLFALFPFALFSQGFGYKSMLGDLDITKTEQSYGMPRKNLSVTGEPLSVAGQLFQNGIGVQADSRISISLVGNTNTIKGYVGINDCSIDYSDPSLINIPLVDGTMVYYSSIESGKEFLGLGSGDGTRRGGSAIFKIMGDGKELFNSGVMRRGDAPKEFNLNVRRVQLLELITESTEDGPVGDHADWLDCELEYREIPPKTVDPQLNGNVPEMDPAVKDFLSTKIADLADAPKEYSLPEKDWLIDNSSFVSSVGKSSDGKDIIMTNGLVSRVFRVFPNLATTDIHNIMTGASMLRTPCREGTLTIDGRNYPLGGLGGQIEYGYTLDGWLDNLTPLPESFRVVDFRISDLQKRLEWNERRWALVKDWNPKGKELTFVLEGPDLLKSVKVELHYAIYDGLPVISKWMDVINESGSPFILNKYTLEELAFVEYESSGYIQPLQINHLNDLYVESDWGQCSGHTSYWETDPRYTSQVDYRLGNPCFLVVRLPMGPDEVIPSGGTHRTFRNWIMPFDQVDRERKGLFVKRFRTNLAPWTSENPIFLHCTTTKPEEFKIAVDQCVETGFEMVVLSFGSGLNMEDESEDNIKKYKEYADYAHSKGLEIGGYSLLASRWISDDVDIINPNTGKRGGMTFGSSPCLSSEWGHEYFRKIKSFYEKTGMDFFEHDGSYSGDPCASTSHAYHKGLEDSQWTQRKMLEDLYKWMRAKGIYMNVPDMGTMLIGSSKCGVGYREVNWSLPRAQQIILGRQNLYDGLWLRTPPDSWTFTPLTQYHGGGAAATLEPLDEHIDAYKAHLVQNFGSGVQSFYRGFRIYDTERTKEMVKEVVAWYKRYRDILNSDVIHLRRPDGKDWDGIMHVNPTLDEKGFVMLYNPTDEDITKTITLPLYYTGLSKKAIIYEQDKKATRATLDREYKVRVKVTIPANGYNWLVIR